MNSYTFKINESDINELKNNIYNSYSNKYSWWDTLSNDNNKMKNLFKKIGYESELNLKDTNDLFDIIIDFGKIKTPKYDTYDFLINGIPVKIYDTYIQYGYDLIPKYNDSSLYSKPTKKIIIDIVTKIKINK